MGTNYIDTYEKQLNERKFALLRSLADWWIATTKKKDEVRVKENVVIQIGAMRSYLDGLQQEIEKAEVTS